MTTIRRNSQLPHGLGCSRDTDHLFEGSIALAVAGLALAAAGGGIALLAGFLGPVFAALFLAAWAAAAVALIAAVMKRARRWWSKEDQDEPEPIQAESNNPKSFSQDEKFSNLDSAGKRKRKSRKIIFSIETIRDEGDD